VRAHLLKPLPPDCLEGVYRLGEAFCVRLLPLLSGVDTLLYEISGNEPLLPRFF